ncbi:hypothetical protein BGI31_05445 [Snodgrassella communis]|nr:hypothetical protein BGI31_05445 [Snodgrassella communis]
MDKQQAVADATATIANSVRTLSADMARKANQERQQAREKAEQELQSNNPELWQDYNQLSEDKKQLVLRETSKDYRTADEQAQSWGIGGGKSRALNAVTSAVTGILGGQTNLQAATNALAPYAAELIGKQFGHGDNQNQATQLVAHALLGAISASVNGGNAAAGAVGASAAELAAQYLIKQLPKDQYPEAIDPRTGEIDPNRLPESVKASIRDLSSAVATVSGGIAGGSLVNAQIAGVAGQNAAENNYLSDAQAAQEQKELKQCTNIGCTAKVKTQWAAINVAQQASFTAGIAVGLPAGAIEPIQELVHMATNPGETYEALKGLFTSGNILGNVSDAVKESYISRLDKLEEEYQRAGASGSYNAGIETGKLLLDMASLATGVGGAVKAGIKVTEKAITKVANAAKKEVIEAGKGAGKGASIAKGSASKGTTSTGSNVGEYLEGFKPSPTPAELVQQQAGQTSKVTINTEHILNGEIKTYKDGTKVGTGGHYLRDPNIKVDKWTGAADANGVKTGYISVRDPVTGKWYKKQAETTFFPEHWSKRQTEMEIESAFKNSRKLPTSKDKWEGISKSGVKMQGYYKKPDGTGATAWPAYQGVKK